MQRIPLFIAVLLVGLVQLAPAALTCCLKPVCTSQITSSTQNKACCAQHRSAQAEQAPCTLAPLADGEKFLQAQAEQLSETQSVNSLIWAAAIAQQYNSFDLKLPAIRAGPYLDQPPASAQLLLIKRSTQLLI